MSSMPIEMPARVAYRNPSSFISIEHPHRDLQAELQVAVLNELGETLLLQKAVDERHLVRQHVIENDAAYRGPHVLLHDTRRAQRD